MAHGVQVNADHPSFDGLEGLKVTKCLGLGQHAEAEILSRDVQVMTMGGGYL